MVSRGSLWAARVGQVRARCAKNGCCPFRINARTPVFPFSSNNGGALGRRSMEDGLWVARMINFRDELRIHFRPRPCASNTRHELRVQRLFSSLLSETVL